jgi:DNA repair protein RecO (recombination protein O)
LASRERARPEWTLAKAFHISESTSMAAEKATGLVVRTHDWSESSRIATIYTRELGKVRALAKGGRRLKSNFEVALDLLSVCSIVLLRKSSGGLDLLTEARVEERFAGLRTNLTALYAGYYIAELLGDGTQDYDPHPVLYDHSLETLRQLAAGGNVSSLVSAYEWTWLSELGLTPVLNRCVICSTPEPVGVLAFSPMAGGILCAKCATNQRDRRPISRPTLGVLQEISVGELPSVNSETRQLLSYSVTCVLGRRPKVLAFLES